MFFGSYNIALLILTYGIPIVVMLICYTLMGRVLWGSRSIGETTERQMESMKSKRKVVRMFIAVVSIFAICWLPYHLFFIYSYHYNQMVSTKYVQHMYLGFYWLVVSNAMVNPMIYYWMNKRYVNLLIMGWLILYIYFFKYIQVSHVFSKHHLLLLSVIAIHQEYGWSTQW